MNLNMSLSVFIITLFVDGHSVGLRFGLSFFLCEKSGILKVEIEIHCKIMKTEILGLGISVWSHYYNHQQI